ncbi:hypothetical protein HNR19_004300 [Nocardioides thalensis]|uniref:Transmembrane protein n=1 Tax=Nocardioides thalensis TaxID=1914755 RepID=A0A853CAC9_9ACTN|nr:hypothetical protein [Nocardioides thalensis]NYJ03602.1 hypothetical protein [Nocardioides thalensis]
MFSETTYYRVGIAWAIGTTLFLVLAAGALGVIGEGGERDRIYLGVIVVLVAGSLIARLRARAMAVALAVTAASLGVTFAVSLMAGWDDLPGASVLELLGLNAMFAALYGFAGWLFWMAGGATRFPQENGSSVR